VSIDSVTDLWDQLLGAQPDPPGLLVLLTALAGLLAVAFRPVWRVARNAVTIAHEGGHALIALLTGRRLRGIRLEFDTSGLTLSAGRPTGPGMMFTLLGGYIAPSLVGVLGAWLLGGNRITLLLWLTVVVALVGGAGVSFGIAAAGFARRGWSTIVGGAAWPWPCAEEGALSDVAASSAAVIATSVRCLRVCMVSVSTSRRPLRA